MSKTHLKEQIAWVSSFFYLLLWGMLPYIIDFFSLWNEKQLIRALLSEETH